MPLLVIPSCAMMNLKTLEPLYPNACAFDANPMSNGTTHPLSATQIMALHLMLHRPRGDDPSEDSHFGPYISTLPRAFDAHPLVWAVKRRLGFSLHRGEEAILACLPPSTTEALAKLEERFHHDIECICAYLVGGLACHLENDVLTSPLP